MIDFAAVSTAISRKRPLSRPSSDNRIDDDGSDDKLSSNQLKRSLQLPDLIMYGVGCSVGAGIYSLVGLGAMTAGPSIALSFAFCGLACCCTSLSYAEFAARTPLAGSAYTFCYVSFGELCGWLVGWNLTLGYAVSAAVVARSWAEYVRQFCQGMTGLHLQAWTKTIVTMTHNVQIECCPLAMVIVAICTLILITGAKESGQFNAAMTMLNLSVLGFVLLSGLWTQTIQLDNLTPVFPHGLSGMAQGAGMVFFSFLGFDMVSCLSEEVANPERNMPIGIIGSLLASGSIYVAISIAVVGMAPVALLGGDVPIINALLANACCTHEQQTMEYEDDATMAQHQCLTYSCQPILHHVLYFGSRFVSFGAIFGLTTATFACLMGQPRIFYSMAQDGLLFKVYGRVNPKTGVPTLGTILTGIMTALIACLIDLESLANAISLGTLQVFTFVNAGVIILRMQPPEVVPEQALVQALGEASPLVRNPQAAAMARSIGLLKLSSLQIRNSIRSAASEGDNMAGVETNGSKPHWFTLFFTISCVVASAIVSQDHWQDRRLLIGFCVLVAVVCAIGLFRLPQAAPPDTFKCPWVPLIPLLGILFNSYMMGSMSVFTWYVICGWLAVGLVFYFSYGMHHSELRHKAQHTVATSQATAAPTRTHYDSLSLLQPVNSPS